MRRALLALALVAVTLVAAPASAERPSPGGWPAPAEYARTLPLAGVRIALDPGHQLGNSRFPRKINRQVPAGGFTKPCNTVGTSTNAGLPEATAVYWISSLVRARLRNLGATVVMTRTSNSVDRWGPCVDARGRFGAQQHARLTLSIHGDGAPASAHGFHVIIPKSRAPWTSDIAAASRRLGLAVRGGLDRGRVSRSSYIGGGTALSVRSDLGTLNMSDVPIAMVELGNMRNAGDARRFATPTGRAQFADALVSGIRAYLKR